MNTNRYRAWRFVHPDAPVMLEESGLRVSARGGIDMVDGDESVRQAILLLLSTVPGERIMRPEYGCLIHQLVFSPNDATTAGLAIHYVQRAIDLWEPRIDVVSLDATQDREAPERLNVTLEYRVRTTLRTGQLTISLSLTGGTS